jgi:DNA-binding transcriptional MerR regulator
VRVVDDSADHGRRIALCGEICLTAPEKFCKDSILHEWRNNAAVQQILGFESVMSKSSFTIADLSREFQITPRTIRHYEDQGLLAPQREGMQRVYSKRDRTRLKLTLRGKRLGLSLAEIRELIDMYDNTADESSQLLKFLAALSRRKAALEQQREDIEAVLAEVCRFERQCQELLAAQTAGKPRGRKAA